MVRWIIVAIVFGAVGGTLAKTKGRNQLLWFTLCAVVPLFIIAILLLPMVIAKGYTKKCAHCAEIIKEDATICKHCGMGNA